MKFLTTVVTLTIRPVVPLAGLLLAALLAAAPALARNEPPADLSPREKAAWLLAECTKLGAEVDKIEALRADYESIDAAADKLNALITMPGSRELMNKRLQSLASRRETLQRRATSPDDPELRRLVDEQTKLYGQYTRSMDQLIRQDAELNRRGVRSFGELEARLPEAESKWKSQQARYPLARAERERVCDESKRAQAQSAPPLKSDRFRVRIEGSVDVEVFVGAAIVMVLLEPYLSDIGMYGPGVRLTLYSVGDGVGAKIGVSGLGDWSEFTVNSPMRVEEFRGVIGGIHCGPDVTIVKSLIGTGALLSFAIPSGTVNVPVTTGNGISFSICSAMAGQWR